MHSHLIPGIDDGSPDMATSLAYLSAFQELGFQKVITTPHILAGLYDNTAEIIREGLHELQKSSAHHGLTVKVEAAAEYMIDSYFETLLETDNLMSFGKSNCVLIEMSFVAPSPQLEQVIFKLLTKGYKPVLAHPERYNYWHHSPTLLPYIKELGCSFQINLPSLMGYYGTATRKIALHLIKSGLVDFLGTDLHHERHLALLTRYQFDNNLNQLLQKYPMMNNEL